MAVRETARRQAEDRLAATQRQREALEPESLQRDQKRVQASLEQRQEAMRQADTRLGARMAVTPSKGGAMTSSPASHAARTAIPINAEVLDTSTKGKGQAVLADLL